MSLPENFLTLSTSFKPIINYVTVYFIPQCRERQELLARSQIRCVTDTNM